MSLTVEAVRAALAGDSQALAACDVAFSARALADRLPQRFGLEGEEAAVALRTAFLRQLVRGTSVASVDDVVAAVNAHAADIVLAAAYRQGVPGAVEAFRERFMGMVRFVTRQTLSAADAVEAEAESWAALWEKLLQYEGRSNLGTWLYVVVRRWCWSRSRQKPPPGPEWTSEEGMGVEERVAAPDPEVSTQVMCDQFSSALDQCTVLALRALSPQERALLRLRYVHQMPLETLRMRPEIYTGNEPPQPVYGITRRVQRAGKHLRLSVAAELSEHGYDEDACARLLQECEQVQAGMAHRLLEELAAESREISDGALQIDADAVSNPTEGQQE